MRSRYISCLLLLITSSLAFANPFSNTVDLSLEMTTSNLSPNQYDTYSITISIQNEGESTATGIGVSIPPRAKVLPVGGNEYLASQGTFDPYFSNYWTVGELSAGATATIQINLFLFGDIPVQHYAQVMTCAETDLDSTPGNGTCCTLSEDDEATTGEPVLEKPDLRSTNWHCSYEVLQNTNTDISFAIDNQGSAATTGRCLTGVYVSIDPHYDASDVLVGEVELSDLAVGLTDGIEASLVFENFQSGFYYLHLIVDHDEAVNESNENNNINSRGIFIHPAAATPVADQVTPLGEGRFLCSTLLSDGEGVEILIDNLDDTHTEVLVDGFGHIVSTEVFPAPQVERLEIVDNSIIRKWIGNTIDYEKEIPQDLRDEFFMFPEVAEFNDNLVLFAYYSPLPMTPTSNEVFHSFHVVKLDEDMNELARTTLSIGAYLPYIKMEGAVQIDADKVALGFQYSQPYHESMFFSYVLVIDEDLSVIPQTAEVLESRYVRPTGVVKNDCDQSVVQSYYGFTHQGGSSSFRRSELKGNFVDGVFEDYYNAGKINRNVKHVPSQYENFFDIDKENGDYIHALEHTIYLPVPWDSTLYPQLVIATGKDDIEYQRDSFYIKNVLLEMYDLEGGLFFLSSNNTTLELLSMNYDYPLPTEFVDLELSTDFSVPFIEIGEEYSVTFTVVNEGPLDASEITVEIPKPSAVEYGAGSFYSASQGGFVDDKFAIWTVGNLAAGTSASITLDYVLPAPMETRRLIHPGQVLHSAEPDYDSKPGNQAYHFGFEDDEGTEYRSVAIGFAPERPQTGLTSARSAQVFPNPVSGESLNLLVFAELESRSEIQVINLLGQSLYQSSLLLAAGKNRVQVPVGDLHPGQYYLVLRNENGLEENHSFIVLPKP